MQTFLGIVLGWIVLSCTVGPLLTWSFFHSKREAKAARNGLSARSGDRLREENRAGLRELRERSALMPH
jgi:hypothetical protein